MEPANKKKFKAFCEHRVDDEKYTPRYSTARSWDRASSLRKENGSGEEVFLE